MFMEKGVPAKPLFDRLEGRGARASFAKKINVSPARLSNWEKRGIPAAAVPVVAQALSLTTDQYYELAKSGKKSGEKIIPTSDGEKLLVILRAFLDTDDEGKLELVEAARSISGDGAAKVTNSHASRRKRR